MRIPPAATVDSAKYFRSALGVILAFAVIYFAFFNS